MILPTIIMNMYILLIDSDFIISIPIPGKYCWRDITFHWNVECDKANLLLEPAVSGLIFDSDKLDSWLNVIIFYPFY